MLSEELQAELEHAKQVTSEGTCLTLIVALNYGGRQEIVFAARRIARAVRDGEIAPESIDEGVFSSHLESAGVPDPELLIRTGGELRLSNFLLWQLAYGEFLFLPVLWPDFREADFDGAIKEYTGRTRRFGGILPG